jgi:hypothetical protein
MAMLEHLSGNCSDGVTCPNVWTDDADGTVIVQGDKVATVEVLPPAPHGEARVRIPRQVLLEAAAKLQ